MRRVHFITFRNVVLKAYRGNASDAKKALSLQLRDAKLIGIAFDHFIAQVQTYAQQSANAEGSAFEWKKGDLNLDESFAAGKGSALKAAACHFYFLCHKQFAHRADFLNTTIDLTKLMGGNIRSTVFGFGSSSDFEEEQVKSARRRPTAPFEWPPYISNEAAFAENAHEGIWLNPHNHYNIPFTGRGEEKTLLSAFIDSERHFLIAALIAPSGAGKTRLISEWMRPLLADKSNSKWDAGFVNSRESSHWETWTPSTNTLIVIDYAFNYRQVLETIVRRFQEHAPYNIRLLILDHILPHKLHRDFFWGSAFHEQGVTDAKRNLFFEPFPIVLKPEPDQSDLIRDIIAASADPYTRNKRYSRNSEVVIRAAQVLMKISGTEHNQLTKDQVRRRDATRHPLFAALIGQTIYRDPNANFGEWTRRDLITHYFENGRRIPWNIEDNRNEFSEELGPWVGCYVSAATLLRGVDVRNMHTFLPNTIRQSFSAIGFLRKLTELCNRIVASDDQHIIRPFEPDILGETFFLKFVERFETDQIVFGSFIHSLSTFRSVTQEENSVSNFIQSVRRLIRNLSNDDQSNIEVENAWYWLQAFLEPSRFPRNSMIRIAVSVLLVDMVEQHQEHMSKADLSSALENIEAEDLISDCRRQFSKEVFYSILKMYKFRLLGDDRKSEVFDCISETLSKIRDDKELSFDAVRMAAGLDIQPVFLAMKTILGEKFRINPKWGGHILRNVCKNESPAIVQGLIDMGASFGRLSWEDDCLPIHVACQYGNLGVVKTLYVNGATLNPADYVYYMRAPPLMLACEGNYKDLVIWLVDNGADPNQEIYGSKLTCLMVVCRQGFIEIVHLLLRKGADPNRVTKAGVTALMWASVNGYYDVAELLLNYGARSDIKTIDGKDATSGARMAGHDMLVTLLSSYDSQRKRHS